MTRFSDLPPELRFQIWDFALKQEAHDRLLIVFEYYYFSHLLLFRHNASSFLSVNRESRNRAQAFYSAKLPVYEIPKGQLEQYLKPLNRPYTIDEGLQPKGALYISLQWDIFVTSPDNDAVLSDIEAKQDGSFFGTRQGSLMTTCHYITRRLPDKITSRISNVACVHRTSPWRYPEVNRGYDFIYARQIPHSISPSSVLHLWSVFDFRAIKNYQKLGLTGAGMESFIFNVVELGGRGFYEFRDMVVYPNEKIPGAWVLIDPGELQKQNRKVPEPELELKPYEDFCDWVTTKQIKGYEIPNSRGLDEPTESPT
ncbi:uncharacterized protein F4807DRAFT_442188 [Annulohypoxylon truncatum]|uniref:uncharacterized protein n=1 Tax=Annulohypoxylon truncatum TaxID=327061 RepID=UPI0020081F6F|nr:uncharacterized protein F4807DRAFT_442188 [Annulohypoxylon truncatum]KAI1205768.1 hypothetical protein F4807DRAFT_442188 [Annulohypoxylon truncatum]